MLLALAGCGGGDDAENGSSNPLKEAVEKTEAAKTARMAIDVSISGEEELAFGGEGVVDFEHDRNKLTIEAQGQTVDLFADGPDEYVRQGGSGRYQRIPASAQTPVANNPSDSLQYVGTDVVDVKENGEGCYAGKLDFDRVFERVEKGREDEVPEQLRGQKAPVLVCVDDEGRIRRYDVELSVAGAKVDMRSTISAHGEAPALEPLGPDELPAGG